MEACSIPSDGWDIGRYVAPQRNLNVAALSLWGRIGRRACLWVLHLVTREYLYVSIILVRALVWRAVTHFPRPMPPAERGMKLATPQAAARLFRRKRIDLERITSQSTTMWRVGGVGGLCSVLRNWRTGRLPPAQFLLQMVKTRMEANRTFSLKCTSRGADQKIRNIQARSLTSRPKFPHFPVLCTE